MQLSDTPFAAERSGFEVVTQSFLREQHDARDYRLEPWPRKAFARNGNQRDTQAHTLSPNYGGKYMMELADVRNALENTATKLADFRGSL